MVWQPIETAPRDGTRILLYFPAMDKGERIFAGPFAHGMWQIGVWFARPPNPTHWQPLPPPPED